MDPEKIVPEVEIFAAGAPDEPEPDADDEEDDDSDVVDSGVGQPVEAEQDRY